MSLLLRSAFASLAVPQVKDRLVILGSGWGGFNILKRVDKTKYDVTLIR
jgi:NADH dehydrogenase